MLYDSPDYLLDDYYKKIDDTLAKINAATFTDTKANIYIYKGVIANMEFSTVYAIDKDMMNIELSGGMYGGRRPYEDLGLKIKLSDEKRTLQASYGEETDNIDKTHTHKKIFEIGDGEKNLTLNSKVTYDKSTGVINGGANLKTPSGGYIDLNGSGKLQKSGGVTSIEAQEIKLDYNNLFTLIMNGSYRVGTLAVKPQKPAGDTVDLFAADEAQLNSIMDTILGNVEKISSDANKVLTKLIYKPNETNGTEEQKTGETTEASDGETTETTTGEAENSENTESGGSDEAA